MTWRYRTVHYGVKKDGFLGDSFLDEDEMEKSLNSYGEDGWELVSMLEVRDGVVAVFKQETDLFRDAGLGEMGGVTVASAMAAEAIGDTDLDSLSSKEDMAIDEDMEPSHLGDQGHRQDEQELDDSHESYEIYTPYDVEDLESPDIVAEDEVEDDDLFADDELADIEEVERFTKEDLLPKIHGIISDIEDHDESELEDVVDRNEEGQWDEDDDDWDDSDEFDDDLRAIKIER